MKVPEKTEPQTVTQTVIIKEEDFVIQAVEKNTANIVKIGFLKKRPSILAPLGGSPTDKLEVEFVGTGFVLGTEGFVIVPESMVPDDKPLLAEPLAVAVIFEVDVLKKDKERGLVLAHVKVPLPEGDVTKGEVKGGDALPKFVPVVFADTDKVQVGQTAIALGVDNGLGLLLGVVSRLNGSSSVLGNVANVYTTIETDSRYSGGPLLNTAAEVIGINIVTAKGERFTMSAKTIQAMLKEYEETKIPQKTTL